MTSVAAEIGGVAVGLADEAFAILRLRGPAAQCQRRETRSRNRKTSPLRSHSGHGALLLVQTLPLIDTGLAGRGPVDSERFGLRRFLERACSFGDGGGGESDFQNRFWTRPGAETDRRSREMPFVFFSEMSFFNGLVLAVHHREVDLSTRDRIRKHRFHCAHSRCADHVADEQNPQLTLPRLLGADGLPHPCRSQPAFRRRLTRDRNRGRAFHAAGEPASERRSYSRRELPLAGHPGLADLDAGDGVRAHLVGIALEDREVRLLAFLK